MKNISLLRFSKKSTVLYGGLVLLNILIFGFTNPFTSPGGMIIAGFLVAAADAVVLASAVLQLLMLLFPALQPQKRRLIILVGSFELVLLALASIGQLTWRDVLVVIVVWTVGYFYSSYFGRLTRPTS